MDGGSGVLNLVVMAVRAMGVRRRYSQAAVQIGTILLDPKATGRKGVLLPE